VLAARAGDPAAKERLVTAFMPLIGGVARMYRNSHAVNRLELMQDGVVGLLQALERYDPERGTPFWAYASWWVRQAMQHLVAELTRPVVLSDRALRQLARVKDARRVHLQACGREPSPSELGAHTGFSQDHVEHLLAVDRVPRGLEEPLGSEEDSSGTVGAMLADPIAEDAYDRVDRSLQVQQVRGLRIELGKRERAIVRARCGFGGRQQTLREIGGRMGLSAERVRQIEEGALTKLRAAAASGHPQAA
jgi:RNA polymerase sigma factor (sigma-70 family)